MKRNLQLDSKTKKSEGIKTLQQKKVRRLEFIGSKYKLKCSY